MPFVASNTFDIVLDALSDLDWLPCIKIAFFCIIVYFKYVAGALV